MYKRGFTLVEVLLSTVLTAVLLGSLSSLYLVSAKRAAHDTADVSILQQVQELMNSVGPTIMQATQVDLITAGGNTGLRCIMPSTGDDLNADGYLDKYRPFTMSKRGVPRYGRGKRVWFYRADSTGDFNSVGTIIWRAERNDNNVPTAADADAGWAYYYNSGRARWYLITSLNFVVNAAEGSVTVTFNSNSLTRADRKLAIITAADFAQSYSLTQQRKVFWRNWRQ